METEFNNVSITELQGGRAYWRALYYFNLYRLLLATALVTLAVTDTEFALLGRNHPDLFQAAAAGMLLVAILSLMTITMSWPPFRVQAYLQFSLDAVLITTLSYASGGVDSGLNLLLIASVAAGGVVLSGRMSLFFAAFATVLALLQHTVEVVLTPLPEPRSNFIQVGLLGIGFFSTGWFVYWLARRFHAVEAEQQAAQAATARLDRLNEAIVSKSTVGIVVIGSDRRCRLVNDRARVMLGLAGDTNAIPPPLSDRVMQEARRRDAFSFVFRSSVTRVRVQGMRFDDVRIDDQDDEVALFLEDLAQAERDARNLKLAALGRLTASVAHEIRNPLEAISHAGELLAESPELSEQNRKLTGIIENQSNRINNIVKSILQLGRPGAVQRVDLELGAWLERFREHFNAGHDLGEVLAVEGGEHTARVNPDQLGQILTNLCDNALRHTRHLPERPLITVRCGPDGQRGMIHLDVLDRGQGVADEVKDKIFEPFFTTDHRGLGLGLFLARELAQNNRGELDYVVENGVPRFRLMLESREGAEAGADLMVSHG